MKKTRRLAYAIAICCSTALISCGTNDQNAENELQRETKPSPGAQEDARMTDPNTPGAQQTKEANVQQDGASLGAYTMMPSKSITENLISDAELTTFDSVVKQAGLVQELSGTGPYTVLAPTNEAFDALPEGTLEDLMKPENKQRLVNILQNHIIAGKISAADLQSGSTLRTLGNGQLKVDKKLEDVMINGAAIEKADIESSNGVIHIINKVLVPAEK
ncbi:fasciclin domain-containing protein [Pontibacter chitinilyticus]|uniref:fasciclin domain-containing protein n=1 Tax=Pontibacter chitinilyticus TaxID=2674989 RepID=UPI00321B87AD